MSARGKAPRSPHMGGVVRVGTHHHPTPLQLPCRPNPTSLSVWTSGRMVWERRSGERWERRAGGECVTRPQDLPEEDDDSRRTTTAVEESGGDGRRTTSDGGRKTTDDGLHSSTCHQTGGFPACPQALVFRRWKEVWV